MSNVVNIRKAVWETEIDALLPTAVRVKTMLREMNIAIRSIEEDPDANLDDLVANVRDLAGIAVELRKRVEEEARAIEYKRP